MKNYYTGIGSREIPIKKAKELTIIARKLNEKRYFLRSGGAIGADTSFEKGAGKLKEIYLPWKNFNGNSSLLFTPSKEAFKMASLIHPVWNELSYGAKCLHARNVHQVLGQNLETPSDFLVCWTLGKGITGGTATAIKIANSNNIPVYNLVDKSLTEVLELII